jgi:hypothetical protein
MEMTMMNGGDNSRFCKESVTSLRDGGRLADVATASKGTDCEGKLPNFDEITLADYKREKSNMMRRLTLCSADIGKLANHLEEIEEEASTSPEGDAAKLLMEMTATYLAFVEGDKLLKKLDKFISECGWDESDD